MKIFNFIILLGLILINSQYAEAKTKKVVAKKTVASSAIPYCSKTVKKGCVKSKSYHTAKFYSTPKYSHKSKVASNKFKPHAKAKKVAKNMNHSKAKKAKRVTASVAHHAKKKVSNKKKHRN